MDLLNNHTFDEIILATNWTINGEATALFIKKIINQISSASVYRLALGLPINSALDYADNTTLSFAIKNKTKY
jgi:recombination protein RecR